jgi:hypothetical protein
MTLFYRLLLSHLIADFPLQTDEIAKWKSRDIEGIFAHCVIFGLITFILTVPYLVATTGIIMVIIALSLWHLLQDWVKVVLIKRSKQNNIYFFLADQLLHLISLAVAVFAIKKMAPVYRYVKISSLIHAMDKGIFDLIIIIIAVYVASLLLYYFRKTFVDHKVNYSRDWTGMMERLLIICAVIGGGWWLVVVPLAIAGKLLFFRKGLDKIDLIGSPLLALSTGLLIFFF